MENNNNMKNNELNIEEVTYTAKDFEVSGKTIIGVMGLAAGIGLSTSENAGGKAIGYAMIAGCGIGLLNKIIRSLK